MAGSYVRNVSSTWDINKGTLTNITAIHFGINYATSFGMGGRWQSSIEGPTLTKTQYQSLTLEWQFSWGRYP